MNFMFEWKQQYLTSERSERVRYCFCHENIKFISSSQRGYFLNSLRRGSGGVLQGRKTKALSLGRSI